MQHWGWLRGQIRRAGLQVPQPEPQLRQGADSPRDWASGHTHECVHSCVPQHWHSQPTVHRRFLPQSQMVWLPDWFQVRKPRTIPIIIVVPWIALIPLPCMHPEIWTTFHSWTPWVTKTLPSSGFPSWASPTPSAPSRPKWTSLQPVCWWGKTFPSRRIYHLPQRVIHWTNIRGNGKCQNWKVSESNFCPCWKKLESVKIR